MWGTPKNLGLHPFPDPVGHFVTPLGHFGFSRQCSIAGGERVPPAPLGWYSPIFSLFPFFPLFSGVYFSHRRNALIKYLISQKLSGILSRPCQLFWGLLAAILNLAIGVPLQTVSKCPLRREAGIRPYVSRGAGFLPYRVPDFSPIFSLFDWHFYRLNDYFWPRPPKKLLFIAFLGYSFT